MVYLYARSMRTTRLAMNAAKRRAKAPTFQPQAPLPQEVVDITSIIESVLTTSDTQEMNGTPHSTMVLEPFLYDRSIPYTQHVALHSTGFDLTNEYGYSKPESEVSPRPSSRFIGGNEDENEVSEDEDEDEDEEEEDTNAGSSRPNNNMSTMKSREGLFWGNRRHRDLITDLALITRPSTGISKSMPPDSGDIGDDDNELIIIDTGQTMTAMYHSNSPIEGFDFAVPSRNVDRQRPAYRRSILFRMLLYALASAVVWLPVCVYRVLAGWRVDNYISAVAGNISIALSGVLWFVVYQINGRQSSSVK